MSAFFDAVDSVALLAGYCAILIGLAALPGVVQEARAAWKYRHFAAWRAFLRRFRA